MVATLLTFLIIFFSACAAEPLRKIEFPETVIDDYGAKCLDGSPAAYYLREVPSSSDWVIMLQGGGLCISAIDCMDRSHSDLGSSKEWGEFHKDRLNVLNDDPAYNPFVGFNAVWAPYCSGDTWMGTLKNEKSWFLGGLYPSGHLILEAILDHLYNTTSMNTHVGRVLFTGESAGGIGVIHNADWLSRTIKERFGFKDAVVKAAPQSGMYFPSRPDAGVCIYQAFEVFGEECPRFDVLESRYVYHEEHAFLDEDCTRETKDLSDCWDAGIALRYVKTPTFIAQNRYDENQISNEMTCSGCSSNISNMSDTVKGYMSYFGQRTEDTLRDLAQNFGHSVFMPNCFVHCEDMCMTDGAVIHGHTLNTSLSDWFFNGVHHEHYDDCGTLPCQERCKCNPSPQPPVIVV